MSFKDIPTNLKEPKHIQMVEAVKAHDLEESQALWDLITGDRVSAEKVSTIIREEMPIYTDDKNLHTLSARQIHRIRKGQLG